ncbi:NADH-quinone oxidoreductase subunit N [Haloferula sargassicola]|uniref:NADH-quinone oxidoreductase subunit N n=1 Tax=Haloferula sargassicola TaxID=490096 RepID=A0ABP9UJT4_9BACT
MKQDLIAILPQLVVLATAMAVLCFEMLGRPRGGLITLATGMLAATALGIAWMGRETTAFSGTFRVDTLSHWAILILCPSAILVALLARSEVGGRPREGTLYSLLVFSTLGSAILAGAGDLMFLVLGVLLNGLSGFALAAHPKDDPSSEGAMKYFIYGSVTGAIMTFGLAYWVGMTGTTYLSALAGPMEPLPYALGFIALLAGLGYAASLFPFHFWTPDTFEGAPVSVAAFLSVTPKIGAIFALAQVTTQLPDAFRQVSLLLLALVAAASMTFGNVVALWQDKLVRLLAYSTVAQSGYFLLGPIAIGHSPLALPTLVVFGIAYAAMNLGAFAIVLAHGRTIDALHGLGRRHPWAAAALTVFLLSLVGIPPLAGFAGKFLLFGAALDAGFGWLAVIAILNSAISLAVYLRIIHPVYFKPPSGPKRDIAMPLRVTWATCLFLTLAAGLGMQWMIAAAR